MSIFSSDDNTRLSSLSSEELIKYKSLLNEYFIDYRDTLNIDKNIQFGLEIEYDKYPREIIDDFIYFRFPRWKSIPETSLIDGGEITSPILTDTKENWQELKEICEFLRIAGASESEDAGAHIHVCADILGDNPKYWLNLIRLIMAYENVLYRFSAGEYTRLRNNYVSISYPIAIDLLDDLDNIDENLRKYTSTLLKILKKSKFQSINFKNVLAYNLKERMKKNTIEFRFPNSTLQSIIWQNNVNTFIHFLLASKKELDEEYIDYRIDRLYDSFDSDFYDLIDEEGAIRFADEIFDNDLDKASFLREYYKDFSPIGPYTPYKLTKRFINN